MSNCLIGITKCGCAVRALVISDKPQERKRQTAFIRECIADGLSVSQQSTEWVREHMRRCTHADTTAAGEGV